MQVKEVNESKGGSSVLGGAELAEALKGVKLKKAKVLGYPHLFIKLKKLMVFLSKTKYISYIIYLLSKYSISFLNR